MNKDNKKLKIIIIIVAIAMIVGMICILSSVRFKNRQEAYVEEISSILFKYEIHLDKIEFSKDYKYHAIVDVTQGRSSYQAIYNALKEIQAYDYESDFFCSIWFDSFNKYETTRYHGWGALALDDTVLWTEGEGNLSDNYKDIVPFYGVDEFYISNTILGPYDDMELCRDYAALDADHQSITYYWYDDNGNIIFKVRTLAGEVITTVDYRGGVPVFDSPSNHLAG